MVYRLDLFFALFNSLALFVALVTFYGYLLGRFNKSIWSQFRAIAGFSFSKHPCFFGRELSTISWRKRSLAVIIGVCLSVVSRIILNPCSDCCSSMKKWPSVLFLKRQSFFTASFMLGNIQLDCELL